MVGGDHALLFQSYEARVRSKSVVNSVYRAGKFRLELLGHGAGELVAQVESPLAELLLCPALAVRDDEETHGTGHQSGSDACDVNKRGCHRCCDEDTQRCHPASSNHQADSTPHVLCYV